MEHAWCSDISRDAAVRAAEDGRDRPLPTLEECIERQKQSQTARPCGGTDPAPLGGEPSGAGNGMRTERVTLEITQLNDSCYVDLQANDWSEDILWLTAGESVRVVEEAVGSVDDRAYADRMGCDEERDFANRILAERDAAIRERDEARKSWLRSEESGTRLLAERNAALDAADGLRKRVAELEAASGGGEKKPMRMPSREWFARMVDVDEANISVGGLASRVAEVEAASGGEQEPDAWGIVRDGNVDSVTHRLFRNEAGDIAEKLGGTVVPLYRAPPQPRGWLTEEERELIAGITDDDEYTEEGQNIAKGLLARSTPPEVVLPELHTRCEVIEANRKSPCLWFRRPDVIAALAAAGVEVKEVGGG